ncbi:TonB-dependent receptor [Flavobacterium sp. CYK-55]|uniref:TonB-dependent receptor domain-containing protein n=1 Tax=Flavobacterium sp. CYK-55 TaxID=2835529 RepID=UPI001BCDB394|nr:outer membrane beta-barrel family protein [Flavobacterium sp. CYK-55]MBS7787372.1 TonB-dependent receptor [Flavobacterium sp. CYK-55]
MRLFYLGLFAFFCVESYAQETPKNTKTKDSTAIAKPQELSEVTIYGNKRQYIKVESDKTTVNVKNNPMLNSGSSLDAVKKIPGVITSPSGSLTLNAKGVTIYIDGMPSSLSGTDLQNYLLTLPATAIEKIELIYNPGASYDANASGSIINIITNSRKMKGVNASFNINYNFNKYQKPSPQILLSGKAKKVSWQTMVGYNYIDSEVTNKNDQTFTDFNPDEMLKQKNFAQSTNRNFYWRTGANYKLSDKSNLLVNYNVNLANDRVTNEATTTGTGIDFLNNGLSKNKNNNHEISLQYKTKLDTLDRTLDIIAFTNFFDKNPITKSHGINNGTSTFYGGDVDFKLANHYLKYDFAIPFKKMDFSLNTGGKFNFIKVTDKGIYALNSATPSVTDFDYKESNLAFYLEARKKIKKLNLTAGLRFEDYKVNRTAWQDAGRTDVDFKNTNFFPNASAMYEFTNDINLTASYSKKIQQADYNVLDPNNFSNFDQYNTSGGNPFLDPTFFDNYEVKLSAFQFVQLSANRTDAKDVNKFIFEADPSTLVSKQTFRQFDKLTTNSINFSFPIPLDYFLKGKEEFQKRMNDMDKMNYIFCNISYIDFTTKGYDFQFKQKPIMSYYAQAQIILPWSIKSSFSYNFTPPGTWEIYSLTKNIKQFDVSLTRDFMDKKLKIGLHCFDVFNENEINAVVSSTNLQTVFYQKPDTRTFRFSLTYNFGNMKLQKENTEIQTEKTGQGGGILK